MKKTEVDYRCELAVANKCRSWLLLHGFITERESMKIHERLVKFRDRHKIKISEEQIHSVVITYKGDAKGE